MTTTDNLAPATVDPGTTTTPPSLSFSFSLNPPTTPTYPLPQDPGYYYPQTQYPGTVYMTATQSPVTVYTQAPQAPRRCT